MNGFIYDSLDFGAKGLANAVDQNRVGERVLFAVGVRRRHGILSQRDKRAVENLMAGGG